MFLKNAAGFFSRLPVSVSVSLEPMVLIPEHGDSDSEQPLNRRTLKK